MIEKSEFIHVNFYKKAKDMNKQTQIIAEVKTESPFWFTYASDTKFVWNSRDLDTWENKQETFAQARSVFSGWLCQASNIKHKNNIHYSADAALIGTNLEGFKKSLD